MPGIVRLDLQRELKRLLVLPVRSPVQARTRQQAGELIASDHLVHAMFSFRAVDLDSCEDGYLHAAGEVIHGPRLVPASGRLTALAVGVATIGKTLEQRVTALFTERKPSLALALDELGTQLLFEAGRKLQDRMLAYARKNDLSMAGELRAGDPGLDLSYQKAVVRLGQGGDIGVQVNEKSVLTPLKSTAMVMGIGVDLPPATWSRCDDCPSQPRCRLSRPREDVLAGMQVGSR